MAEVSTWDVIIIGGGLAGLCCASQLAQSNCRVLLIEKHAYPHHKVCGEYVSNEVLPHLKTLGIDPLAHGAKQITKFEISTKKGKVIRSNLQLGGFGMSRYTLDNLLYESIKNKVAVIFDTVDQTHFDGDGFIVKTKGKSIFQGNYVVGAYGKRSNVDSYLNRDFFQKSSPWIGVKAHYQYDFPDDTVALHNFQGGYCGLSRTESNVVNACYLTSYKSFKSVGSIEAFQEKVLIKNPHLAAFYGKATPLFKKPLSIGQISFHNKAPVEDHIFMIGDSAGLIHPLCGNGMAMAIHSAKLFSDVFLECFQTESQEDRTTLESIYAQRWYASFTKRLKTGRFIQGLLLKPAATTIGYGLARMFPSIVPRIINQTHGDPII